MRRSCGVLTGGEGTQQWPEYDADGNEIEQIEETAASSSAGLLVMAPVTTSARPAELFQRQGDDES
jgi:hypothetical protein